MRKLNKIFILLFIYFFLFNYFITYSLANEIENTEEEYEIKDTLSEVSSKPSKEPSISSRAAVVLDRASNTILYGKEENQVRKMASTTKIMTAIIILENCNLTDTVTVSKKAAGTGGSRLGLKTGDKITIFDLLHGLMLCSGNDAAVALAEHAGNNLEGFAILMNKKAKELGLKNTHYVTPHGLDNDEHYTTAYELALLTNYALENKTFKNLVGTQTYIVTINGQPKNIRNTNELLGALNGVYGVKTGFTNGANRCLVTSTKRGNLDIICVVLGADTKKIRTQDSAKLIEYTFSNFEVIELKEKIENKFKDWNSSYNDNFHIIKGNQKNVNLKLENIPYEKIAIQKGNHQDIFIDIEANFTIHAPINANEIIGYLYVKIGNENIMTLPIYITHNITRKNFFDNFYDLCKNYSYYLNTFVSR